jgi:MoxR-like ATPase
MNDYAPDSAYAPPPDLRAYVPPPQLPGQVTNPERSVFEPPMPSAPRPVDFLKQIRAAVEQVFIGQTEVIHQVLAALLAGGHVLLEGKPGLGKTHLVLALARTFGAEFKRIQFTPDLMPSDVTGHTGAPRPRVHSVAAGG